MNLKVDLKMHSWRGITYCSGGNRTSVGTMLMTLWSSRAIAKTVIWGKLGQDKEGRGGTDMSNISGIDRYGLKGLWARMAAIGCHWYIR